MSVEIERKFLVRGNAWRELVTSQTAIRQAYLASGSLSSTRVRIKNGTAATLTIKSRKAELRRLEVECVILVADAEALIALRQSGVIEKIRYTIPWRNRQWEVDVFSGGNAGLIIAEIELGSEQEHFEHPAWLGVEVTGQGQYYNGSLAERPFQQWTPTPTVVVIG